LTKFLIYSIIFKQGGGEMTEWEEERDMRKKEAKYWLQLARERCTIEKVDSLVAFIWARVKQGIKLEDIGTSEEELRQLLLKGYKAEAEKWLQVARKHCTIKNVDCEVEVVREYVEKARIKLEDIGTSEEELEKLLRTGYQAEAEKWLRLARERCTNQNVDSEVELVRKYVEKAGIKLENIETSKDELEKLVEKGRKAIK
jgi:DNA repair ATPase RecN